MKEAERNISALDQAITAYLMSENDQTASTTKTQTNATGTSTAETSLDFKTDADEQRQNMSAQRHASSQSNRSQDPSSKGQQNLKQPSIDHRICDDTEEIDSKDLRSGDPFLQGYERQIDVSEHPHGLAEDSHVAGTIPSSSQDAPPDFQIPHIDSWSIPCDAQKSPQVVWDLEDLKRRAQAYSQAQTQNPQSPLSEGSQIVEESAPRLAQAESLVQKANRLEEEEPELSIVDQLKILASQVSTKPITLMRKPVREESQLDWDTSMPDMNDKELEEAILQAHANAHQHAEDWKFDDASLNTAQQGYQDPNNTGQDWEEGEIQNSHEDVFVDRQAGLSLVEPEEKQTVHYAFAGYSNPDIPDFSSITAQRDESFDFLSLASSQSRVQTQEDKFNASKETHKSHFPQTLRAQELGEQSAHESSPGLKFWNPGHASIDENGFVKVPVQLLQRYYELESLFFGKPSN